LSRDLVKDCGIVVRWNRTYGFVRPDGGGQRDVYCNLKHVIDRELVPGTRVCFHLAPDPRFPERPMAVDVEIVR
jgi:cold shock CspA family protein